nr:helix-turn-helix transcriptional regulator [Fredinandcohnia onubensis]
MEKLEEAYSLLMPLVKSIANALGPNCEVVLHNLKNMESSIVAIENGHITGRKVGDPSTNLGLQAKRDEDKDSDILNYSSTTKDGKTLKSSSIYIRNDKGSIVGALCINHNITDFIMASHVINSFIETEQQVEETFSGDINDVIEGLLQEAVKAVGKPVPFMNKEDKINILKFLDDKGVFTVKRSMERVALLLDVSKYTLYNYLEEMRVSQQRRNT